MCTVVVLQGHAGSGKSTILLSLQKSFGTDTAEYIDISNLAKSNTKSGAQQEMESQLLDWFYSARKRNTSIFLIDNIDNPNEHFANTKDSDCSDISYVVLFLKNTINSTMHTSCANNSCLIITTCTSLHNIYSSLLIPTNAILSIIKNPNEFLKLKMMEQLVFIVNQYFLTSWVLDPSDDVTKMMVSQTQGHSMSELVALLKHIYMQVQSYSLNNHRIPSLQDIFLSSVETSGSEWNQDVSPAPRHQSSNIPFIQNNTELDSNVPNGKKSEFSTTSQQQHPSSLVGIDDIMSRVNNLLYGCELSSQFLWKSSSNERPLTLSPEAQALYDQYISLLELPSPGGFVISGPAGCGKTSLAQWIAQSGRHRFQSISLSCTDLVHKVSECANE